MVQTIRVDGGGQQHSRQDSSDCTSWSKSRRQREITGNVRALSQCLASAQRPGLLILATQLHGRGQVFRSRNLWQPFSFQHHGLIWAHSSGMEPTISGKAWREGREGPCSVSPNQEAESDECSRSSCFFLGIRSGIH